MDSSVIEILKRQQILETFKPPDMKKKQKSTPHNTVRIFSESAGHLPLNETNTGKGLPLPVLLPLQPLCFPLQMWDIYG
ncbi:hypothetical protein DW999_01745 [Ruminococcus sp. AM54-14NS]|nr:hypothetical protein DW999_01745 [Ruminococcus sp. AM54-14NS]